MTDIESSALSEWEDRLTASIDQHGLAVSSREILEVLADATEPSPPITTAEHEFLTEHLGLTEADLTPQALAAADVEIAAQRARAETDVQDDALTTRHVAQMLHTAPANVRRLVGEGALFSVKATRNGQHLFPRWQFPRGRVLPGLDRIVAALPENYHPREVAAFMTESSDALHGMSPVEWLADGGTVGPVVDLADERAWE
jgi:hypothetical protein